MGPSAGPYPEALDQGLKRGGSPLAGPDARNCFYDTRVSIRRPVSGETTNLVADLLGGDALRVEAATARLLVMGPRALPHLLDALPGATGTARLAVLRVIELLPASRRAVRPLDEAAAGGGDALAAVVGVWASWLAAEDRGIATLAFDRLASVVLSDAADPGARQMALRAVAGLHDAASAELLARVPPDLARAARTPASPVPTGDGVSEPAALRQQIASQGPTTPLSELHRALERARGRQQAAATPDEARDWMATRGAVHQALAARGSTVALYDLRELLERLDGPPPVGAIAALRLVGDATTLEAIATAWTRVDDEWTRDQLRGATAAICDRHRLTGRHPAFRRLAAKAPALAEATPARRTRTSG